MIFLLPFSVVYIQAWYFGWFPTFCSIFQQRWTHHVYFPALAKSLFLPYWKLNTLHRQTVSWISQKTSNNLGCFSVWVLLLCMQQADVGGSYVSAMFVCGRVCHSDGSLHVSPQGLGCENFAWMFFLRCLLVKFQRLCFWYWMVFSMCNGLTCPQLKVSVMDDWQGCLQWYKLTLIS